MYSTYDAFLADLKLVFTNGLTYVCVMVCFVVVSVGCVCGCVVVWCCIVLCCVGAVLSLSLCGYDAFLADLKLVFTNGLTYVCVIVSGPCFVTVSVFVGVLRMCVRMCTCVGVVLCCVGVVFVCLLLCGVQHI